jgi:hypothetical protein
MDDFSFMESSVSPSIEQCFSSPEFSSYAGQKQQEAETAPWEIQQCNTSPDLDTPSQNPFDVFGSFDQHPASVSLAPSQDIVQSHTQDSMYSNYGLEETASFFDQQSQRPSCAAQAPAALIAENQMRVTLPPKIARASSATYSLEASQKNRVATSIATEVMHPWSAPSVPISTTDTYRQGMKGDHGRTGIISLAAGKTNALAATNTVQTKIPLCWDKDLDKIKQEAKYERIRAKLALKKEAKQNHKPKQKCKGIRAVFGSPKELNKKPKTDPDAPKVIMNPNVSKSSAKGSLVKLMGSPKPLQKRPKEAGQNLFV